MPKIHKSTNESGRFFLKAYDDCDSNDKYHGGYDTFNGMFDY